MTRKQPIVALAAACLLLAACGSSTPSSSTGSSAGSHASATRYLAGANAVCARLLAKLDRLTQPTTAEQAVSYLPQALRIMQAENRQLAALDPPAGDRTQLQAGLRSSQQLAALLRRFLRRTAVRTRGNQRVRPRADPQPGAAGGRRLALPRRRSVGLRAAAARHAPPRRRPAGFSKFAWRERKAQAHRRPDDKRPMRRLALLGLVVSLVLGAIAVFETNESVHTQRNEQDRSLQSAVASETSLISGGERQTTTALSLMLVNPAVRQLLTDRALSPDDRAQRHRRHAAGAGDDPALLLRAPDGGLPG